MAAIEVDALIVEISRRWLFRQSFDADAARNVIEEFPMSTLYKHLDRVNERNFSTITLKEAQKIMIVNRVLRTGYR